MFVLLQYLGGQLAQYSKEAKAKISELQMKLMEQEYNIRQEVSQEFSEQLTEIEDKHMYVSFLSLPLSFSSHRLALIYMYMYMYVHGIEFIQYWKLYD